MKIDDMLNRTLIAATIAEREGFGHTHSALLEIVKQLQKELNDVRSPIEVGGFVESVCQNCFRRFSSKSIIPFSF